jgi:hypothetical protein
LVWTRAGLDGLDEKKISSPYRSSNTRPPRS